ncbi:MAG: hypothetical protein ABR527_10505, partial [Gemmatimonadota bacterium]
ARLAAQAGPGEIVISDATYGAAGLDLGELEHRQMALKGKSETVGVRLLRVMPGDSFPPPTSNEL